MKNPYFVHSGTPQANHGLLSPASTVSTALNGFSKKSTKNSIKTQYRPYSSINQKLSIMDVDFGPSLREPASPAAEASAPQFLTPPDDDELEIQGEPHEGGAAQARRYY
jgi:hypothetical protein